MYIYAIMYNTYYYTIMYDSYDGVIYSCNDAKLVLYHYLLYFIYTIYEFI